MSPVMHPPDMHGHMDAMHSSMSGIESSLARPVAMRRFSEKSAAAAAHVRNAINNSDTLMDSYSK